MSTRNQARKPTQEERSSAMRKRLLDATVECLVEFGYAGTTTARVAERAGVTRGAQVHHFPTKADLVTAAIRHLAVQRAEAAYTQLDRVRNAEDALGTGLDLLWEMHQGPLFSATVELWVAARADDYLHDQVADVEPLVTGSLMEFVRLLFPALAEQPQFRHWTFTAMDVMRGILISPHGSDEEFSQQRWLRAKAHLKVLAQALLQQVDPASTTAPNR